MIKKSLTYVLAGGLLLGTAGVLPVLAAGNSGDSSQTTETSNLQVKKAEDLIIEKAKKLGISTEGKDINTLISEIMIIQLGNADEETQKNKENDLIQSLRKDRTMSTDKLKGILIKQAQTYGISTEGKDLDALIAEIMDYGLKHGGETFLKEKTQKEKIKKEDLRKNRANSDVSVEESVLDQAKKAGISTEGKDLEMIALDMMEYQLNNGLKSMEEIEAKAKDLGISTEGKELREILQEIINQLKLKQK
ncbi:hypothetical protein J2Z40_002495 [Cytobacillus eiseniae]|uniref:Uncharacterized protein n=1 Tax=Cytobacillus eiseniae TaxID=762947 RepID=A0ABS4RJD2_9BACI|nr:hypothetical protein [Cytobacillus eiseniae]MBP2241922.1 hypothetical protein [Cytobacillus eiseniae]